MLSPYDLVVSLSDIGRDDVYVVGDKSKGVAEGFVITHRAYFNFLRENNLEAKISHLLGTVNFDNHDSLSQVASHIRNLIVSSKIPDNIAYRVFGHYEDLGSSKVRLRMSIVSGDPVQRQTFWEEVSDIQGDAVLLDTARSLWARLFKPEILIYRHMNNIHHIKTGAALLVQKL